MIGRIFVLVATLTWLGSAPAAAGQDHGGGPTVVQEAAVPEGVDDPVDYVRSVYREYMAGGEVADPSFAYSAELRGLIAAAEREARDEPGRLDFDFWASGQDWVIETVDISEQPQSDGRRIIAARFHNQSVPTLIRFHFVRQNGKYFLDDAENVDGPAENRWRLRQILTEPPIVEGGEEWENFYEGADGSIGAFRKPIAMRDGILSARCEPGSRMWLVKARPCSGSRSIAPARRAGCCVAS